MPADHRDLIALTGRFQPFHADHLGLLLHALSMAGHVLVCITNPDARSLQPLASSPHRHLPAANPFSYLERLRMIDAALVAAGVPATRYDIVPFPLEDPTLWPAYVTTGTPMLVRAFSDWERDKARRLESGGYPVVLLDGDPRTRISAGDIRAAMAAGEPWAQWVPQGTREVLAALGDNELRRRCAAANAAAQPE